MLLMFFTGICFVRRYLSRFYRGLLFHGAVSALLDAPSLRWTSQSSSRHIQVGQRAQHEQGMGILGQATVTYLGKAEHPFDHCKDMLHLGPDFRLGAVARLGCIIQWLVAPAFLMGEVLCTARRSAHRLGLPGIG